MGIFRNFTPVKPVSDDTGFYPCEVSKTVATKEKGVYVEHIVKEIHDSKTYGSQLDMPTSDEYSLDTMLKNGDVPREVPVAGILNPSDSSDPRVASELASMAEQLHSIDENFNINN